MIRKTITTTLRTGADVWTMTRASQRDDVPRLFPGACLRMFDHHLHISGILPRRRSSETDPYRMYDHAWLCASQTVMVKPYATLLDVEDVTSHVWVTHVGNSSLQLGNALMVNDQTLLATAQRVFVRFGAKFQESEQKQWQETCGPEPVQQEQMQPLLPVLRRFDASVWKSDLSVSSPSIWTVPVGPAHVNFGGHADHAFLAETAHHALWASTQKKPNKQTDSTTLAVNYLAEVSLVDTLHCHRLGEDMIVMTKQPTSPSGSDAELVPVLVAQLES